MSLLSSCFPWLCGAVADENDDAFDAAIQQLIQVLGDGAAEHDTIRLWVESGSSYGHHASTANIMYRLARPAGAGGLNLGYGGTIDVYYETNADLPKLQRLIPELNGGTTCQIGAATVRLFLAGNVAPAPAKTLGLTGGASEADTNYADKLGVDFFLQLQPYRWTGGAEAIHRPGQPKIDLTNVPAVGGARFKRRLYNVDQSLYANPPWPLLANLADQRGQAVLDIVQELFGDAVIAANRVQAAYSIKDGSPRFNQNTAFGAAVICAAAFEWQQHGTYARAQPVIIVNFDTFGAANDPAAEEDLRAVLGGGFARDESMFELQYNRGQRAAVDNFRRRKSYFESLAVGNRLAYLNYPDTLAEVTAAVDDLAGHRDHVLFVQLGGTFPAAFSYALFRSGLPPIFEGQNTANDAVNMGRPYLQVPSTNSTQQERLELYPSVTMSDYSSRRVPQDLVRAAGQISSSPQLWPTSRAAAAPVVLGDFYRRYTDEDPSTGPTTRYFARLQQFFASRAQDKLLVALAYLQTLLPAQQQLLGAGAGDDPLDALWDKIDAAVKAGGPVDLVPGIVSGGEIAKLAGAFPAGGVTLDVQSFDPAVKPAPVTRIALTGKTHALGVDTGVVVVLTAPDGKLTADLTFTGDEQWSMPDAPWMAFERPFVELTIPDADLPVQATIGGYYPPLAPDPGARLEIGVFGANDRWPASITFGSAPYPDIAKAFQLATGFNLVRTLPPPFNAVADLGIRTIEVEYDYAAKSVDSVAVVAQSNTPGLKLLGNLELDDLVVSAVVLDPTGSRQLLLGVSAQFGLGTVKDPAVVTISLGYPDGVIQGSLSSGTPTFTDLVATFVPDLGDASLPHEPQIDAFSFTYNNATDYLTVSAGLTMPEWTFTFPGFSTPLVSLDSVSFVVTREKGANSGNILARTELLPGSVAPIEIDIGGAYQDKDLTLTAKTPEKTTVDPEALIKEYLPAGWWPDGVTLPALKDLSVTLVWGPNGGGAPSAKSYEFKAKTATAWKPIDALDVSFTADLTLGYKATPAPGGAYGKLGSDVTLWGIHLGIELDFDPKVKQVCVTWKDVGLKACVETKDSETIATFTLEDQTIGGMVEKFVSWATGTPFGLMAPFDVLDDISLNGLAVTYNFTKKTVGFTVDVGPIDLGLLKITGVTLAYNPGGNAGGTSSNKVEISVDGTFPWLPDADKPLSWEPDDPASTPAPPGGGNKYLDLRLLALGQHVTVTGLDTKTNVDDVITALEKLDIPKPPEIPVGGDNQPIFDPTSSWFVGFDFGVLKVEKKKDPAAGGGDDGDDGDDGPDQYFISLAVVFNDPHLYALRIGLDGPMAKALAGLVFQIMYQQVSQNVGRYSAQLALPTVMRKLQIGVASVTLPTFAIEVYTNGDFQVDLGFPWNQDFTRSFAVEFQAGPLPVVGAAGFYFGKLSSATTDKLPAHSHPGWFNPVIVFGFGAQVGLGKSFDAGVLKAGFSVTVFGIIEGVIARWQPYGEPTHDGDKTSLQDGYYFSLTGTFGLQGHLYGSIDFAIISAELDVEISLYVQLTFASYQPIPITAKASVSVTLTVKINLGLFSISIHLSFSANVETTFVLDNPMGDPSQAPWNLSEAGGGAPALPAPHRLAARRLALAAAGADTLGGAASFTPKWSNLEAGTPLQMQGWVAPVLTVAGDGAASPADQQLCYVLNFFLAADPPIEAGDDAAAGGSPGAAHVVAAADVPRLAAERARAGGADATGGAASDASTFEDLAVRVLLWVIAAGQDKAYKPEDVCKLVVSDDFLAAALTYLSGATPVDQASIESFLGSQTSFCFALEQEESKDGKPVPAVFFPAAPGVVLDVPAFGGQEAFHYAFGGYNASSGGYLSQLNTYFNALKVQAAAEQGGDASGGGADDDGPSIATYVFGDYFAMIGRLTIQAMRDGLRNFKLLLADHPNKTPQDIVGAVNTAGSLTGPEAYTVGELFAANQTHPLNPAAGTVAITTMTWRAPGGQSFADVAGLGLFGGGFDATALALANATAAKVIAGGVAIGAYKTQGADSLATIAVALGYVDGAGNADVAALLKAVPDLLARKDLLAAQALLAVPPFHHTVASPDSLQTVAAQYAITLDALADANAGVTNLFLDEADHVDLDVPHLPQYRVADLVDEMRRTLALQHTAAMASRYYLHGLRLPTKLGTEGLTPKADGLFVKAGGQYPPDLGLFALTGQAFPVAGVTDPSKPGPQFAFSVDATAESWLSLGAAGQKSVTFTLSTDQDFQRYSQVQAAASGFLDTGSRDVGPLDVAGVKPRRFPLSTELPWQPAVDVTLPRQPAPPVTARPRLWPLPDELVNVPAGDGVRPVLAPLVNRVNEATGATVDEPVANYGFGTLVSFTVKRPPDAAATGPARRSYEVIGAPESEITLLERLLDQLTDDPSSFDQVVLLYRPSASGSEAKGWQSDDPASSVMGLTQTNLSTDTRPPAAGGSPGGGPPKPFPNLIGTPNEFLRLLWEASITRSGGFFLGYANGLSDPKGLPDHAFNDRGEAEVAVLALFAPGADGGQALANFMNVAVTNEGFDLTNAALVAEAVPTPVTGPRQYAATDTLTTYAATYYTDPAALAAANASVAFAPGVSLTVAGGLYQVPPDPNPSPTPQDPGADLTLIAEHFKTSPSAIRSLNGGSALPDPLPPLTAIKLPQAVVSSTGQSFRQLADYYGVPVAELAATNRDVTGLYPPTPSPPLAVTTGPATLAPLVRRGVAGMRLERDAPQVPDTPVAGWGLAYLRQNFSLLGYRVAANLWFGADSASGLPAGPVDPDAAPAPDKVSAPRAPAAGDTWDFRFSVPYASVLAAGDAAASPYGGVGDVLQLELAWLDIFGNRVLSELDDPAPAAGTPFQRRPQLLGYTDRLTGLGQWPAVTSAYRIVASGGPSLSLQLDFDPTSYQGDKAADRITQGVAAYTLIAEQLADPAGVTIDLTTSVTPGAMWQVGDDLRKWAGAILAYLQALQGAPATAPAPPAAYTAAFPLTATVNADQIFQLETTITIRRDASLVAGELAPVAGVAEAATSIAASTGPLAASNGDQPQRDLSAFAKDFAAAFASLPGTALRIATGADRSRFSATAPLWVVQLGKPGAAQPISFTIKDAGDPTVYAPRPISNALQSRPSTQIIQYTKGSVIQPDGPSVAQAFTSIDLDHWMTITLAYIDELFSPKYVAPADILRSKVDGPDALGLLVDAKRKLADNLKSVMIPVYKGETADDQQLADIREAYKQSMLAALGGFYAVKAGIQFEADVKAAIRRRPGAVRVPRVFGDVVDAAAGATPSISLSSPKLDLRFADAGPVEAPPSPYLSSLVSSAAIDAKCVSLALTYDGRYIEHEIGALPGIEGYEPSSWLGFVDTGDSTSPLGAELGTFDVPIVLREFPATPMLVNQDRVVAPDSPCHQPLPADAGAPAAGALLAGGQCSRPGTYDPLATATRWTYSFTYSLQVHRQQDEIHGVVSFNIADPDGLGGDPPARDVFDNLAQFTQVYPQVLADLDACLVPIDVATSDADQLKNAQAALQSAAAMIDWLASSPPGLQDPALGGAAATSGGSIGFTISEGSAPLDGVEALTITVVLDAALPPRVGAPYVEIDGYACERQTTTEALTSVFAYKDTSGDYLPATKGMNIAARTFVLPDLDVLERQDARAEVNITRNADLVPHKTIDDPFVYRTPTVSFDQPLHPLVVVGDDQADGIDLATIYATGPDDPVQRPLECQLGLLYEALFANAGTDDVTMQATLSYEYAINGAIAKVRLPVYLMPPTRTKLRDGGAGTPLADVVAMQVAGWTTWFEANQPETSGGSLLVDLTVMSDLTSRPMPILRLPRLFVLYANLG